MQFPAQKVEVILILLKEVVKRGSFNIRAELSAPAPLPLPQCLAVNPKNSTHSKIVM